MVSPVPARDGRSASCYPHLVALEALPASPVTFCLGHCCINNPSMTAVLPPGEWHTWSS